jgi:hypothetical protein
LKVTDVEQLKKQVRKMAAGHVLEGGVADAGLDLARMEGCQARLAAGYGPLSPAPRLNPRDRLLWILDGHVEVQDAAGQVTHVRQGECTILSGGGSYRLFFPQLSIYLSVEATEGR